MQVNSGNTGSTYELVITVGAPVHVQNQFALAIKETSNIELKIPNIENVEVYASGFEQAGKLRLDEQLHLKEAAS